MTYMFCFLTMSVLFHSPPERNLQTRGRNSTFWILHDVYLYVLQVVYTFKQMYLIYIYIHVFSCVAKRL